MNVSIVTRDNCRHIAECHLLFRRVTCIHAIATAVLLGGLGSATAQQVSINVNDYLVQASGSAALCTDNTEQCVHEYPNQFGEMTVFYAQGSQPVVVDYVARSYGSGGANGAYYIGPSRSLGYNAPTHDYTLYCFSDPGQTCTAPPSTSMMPQAVPRLLTLNVVLPSEDDAASDPTTGTPIRPLNGTYSITGITNFQVVVMGPGCQQQLIGLVQAEVRAAFLYQYPFGGDLGTQNALVIEEIEYQNYNGSTEIGHIERYYHINGYGRVRDSVAFYDPSTQSYTPGSNPIRRNIRNVADVMPPEPPNDCPQGTKPFNEPP